MKQFELPDWAEGTHCAITVCDTEGNILYMNEQSRQINNHGESMVGQNLMPCHNERSQQIIHHLLESDTVNCYTIQKKGMRKMIYQTPWRDADGQVMGLVEISMIIPEEMPHYDRG